MSLARRGRLWGGLVLAAIALLTVAVLLALGLWHTAPGYWNAALRQRQEASPEQQAAIAEHFETRTSAAVTGLPQSPADTTRKIVLPFDDINAWLDRRLRLWLDSQRIEIPAEVGPVVVAARGDQLVLAFRVTHPRIDQVFSLAFTLTVERDDRAVVRLVGVRGGRLPIPLDLALQELPASVRNAIPPDVLQLVEQAREGIAFEPVFRIDSVRHVRVLTAQVSDEALTLIVRQEH